MAEWNNLSEDSINEDEEWKYFSAKTVDGFSPIYSIILYTIKSFPHFETFPWQNFMDQNKLPFSLYLHSRS